MVRYFEWFVAGQGLTAEELGSLCAGAGFADVKVERRTDFPGVLATGAKPLAR